MPEATATTRILPMLTRVKQTHPGEWVASCPCSTHIHGDLHPSLSIRQTEDRILLHCHAGDSTDAVVQALGLTINDLFDDPKRRREDYTYKNRDGEWARTVHRTTGPDGQKQIRQDVAPAATYPLYRLDEVAQAVSNKQPIYLPEGEKDVETLRALGLTATTSAGGATNWDKTDYTPLIGTQKVIILADKDQPGHDRALALHAKLTSLSVPSAIQEPAIGQLTATHGADITDHLNAGYRLDQLIDITPTAASANHYEDVAAFFANGMPQPPRPDLGHRADGIGIFYRSKVNILLGPPESGKTLALQCIALDTIADGGHVLHIDLDHNGLQLTMQRYASLVGNAAPMIAALSDPERFRYTQPDDPANLDAIITDTHTWQPDLIILDSLGELIPLYGGDSNSADDYSTIHRRTLTTLANTGAAVVAVDHEAKNRDSARYGAAGTMAKKRAVDGLMLRASIRQPFAPGRGGIAALLIVKDRPGGARAATPPGDDEPCYAMFELSTTWQFRPITGTTNEHITDAKLAADIANLTAAGLNENSSQRDVKARLHWGSDRAINALKALREQSETNNTESAPITLGALYEETSNE